MGFGEEEEGNIMRVNSERGDSANWVVHALRILHFTGWEGQLIDACERVLRGWTKSIDPLTYDMAVPSNANSLDVVFSLDVD